MFATIRANPALLGASSALIAVLCFSTNDVVIKFLSDGYALHQIVLMRAIIALVVLLCLIVPFSGGTRLLKTRKLRWHLLRGACVVAANMLFFLGLAAMPLAEGVAIAFIAPTVITVLSVVLLGEKVGPWRWFAVVVGFIGVLIVVRPGTDAFRWAAMLPLLAAVAYAMLHIITRHIGGTESAVTLAFYIQIVFIVVGSAFGLAIGDGRFAGGTDPSLNFLFRAWIWPRPEDAWVILLIGITSVIGGVFISLAYRVAEAGYVAPFEYAAMPIAVVFGLLVFGEWPDLIALAGIALILGSGLLMVWRETRRKPVATDTPTRR